MKGGNVSVVFYVLCPNQDRRNLKRNAGLTSSVTGLRLSRQLGGVERSKEGLSGGTSRATSLRAEMSDAGFARSAVRRFYTKYEWTPCRVFG